MLDDSAFMASEAGVNQTSAKRTDDEKTNIPESRRWLSNFGGRRIACKLGGLVHGGGRQGFPRRKLGRTDDMISTVGFPGLSLRNYSQEEGTAKLH